MDKLLFVLTQKLAVLFVLSISSVGGFLSMTPAHDPAGAQTAIISNSVILSASVPVDSFVNPIAITPGLLGTSTAPFCPASSTCSAKTLRILVAEARKNNTLAPGTTLPSTSSIISIAIPTPPSTTTAPLQQHAIKIHTIAPANGGTPMTAQQILADATIGFHEQRNGPYDVLFDASSSNGENLAWDLSDTSIGGTGTIPKDTISYNCNPTPDPADPGAPDQNPMFKPKTAYSCSLSLTPASGTDLATQSRTFTFTTPSGELFVTSAVGMNTVLSNNSNQGGIVFDNEDTSPITITGITVDVVYTQTNAVGQPLILRVLDPVTEQSIGDYHLESSSTAPTSTYSVDKPGITIPLSFVVPGSNQKMLPIEVLGVQKMLVPGTSPSINITVKDVTTNRTDVKTNLANVVIDWSCSIPIAGYDPYATSGPFYSGSVCKN